MGKILVKQAMSTTTPIDPNFTASRGGDSSGLFTGSGGPIQSIISPERPDIGFPWESGPTQAPTLGKYPANFIHPITGRTTAHPLAGQDIVNPNAGQAVFSPGQRAAMFGLRGLGAGLGAYSALMSFANDDDQDALTSGLNALGSGYTTYASTAPLERGVQAFSERNRARDTARLSTDHAVAAMKPTPAQMKYLQNIVAARQNARNPAPVTVPTKIPIPKVTGPYTTISRPTVPIPPVDESGITIKPRDDTPTETSTVKTPEDLSDVEHNEYAKNPQAFTEEMKKLGITMIEGESPF